MTTIQTGIGIARKLPVPMNPNGAPRRDIGWPPVHSWVSPRAIKETFVPARDYRYPSMADDGAI